MQFVFVGVFYKGFWTDLWTRWCIWHSCCTFLTRLGVGACQRSAYCPTC